MSNLPADQPSPTPSKPGLATLFLHHSITVLILILFLSLGTWTYLTFQKTDFFATVDRAEFEAELRPTLEAAQRHRIEVALMVYELIEGRFPGRLHDLVDSGLLVESDLYYPRAPGSLPWSYERHGESFVLERPDGPQVE